MPLPTTIRILILSNQILYLEALKSLLSSESEDCVIETYSVKNPLVLELSKEFEPTIILLDANGMGKDIWDFLYAAHAKIPNAGILMLANTNEPIYLEHASRNGATGYVLKSSPKEILIGAIKIVQKGGVFFDPGMNNHSRSKERPEQKYNLSEREMEVVTLIKDGLSTKDIANQLQLSFHTVETHRKNIYNKLNIRKVTELIKFFADMKSN